MKRLKASILALITLIILINTTTTPAIALTDKYYYLGYTYSDIPILEQIIQEQEDCKLAAHNMARAARQLGYTDSHVIITTAQQRWSYADFLQKQTQTILDELSIKWQEKKDEYPEATYIWEYLKSVGYNDYVCAGILGNMMVESGGHTLAIQPMVATGSYVGICQWSLKYFPEAKGLNLEGQCKLLTDTIEEQFEVFSWVYKKNFSLDAFKELTDCEQVALAFAKVYERCGQASYSYRQKCAVTAYNYFVG